MKDQINPNHIPLNGKDDEFIKCFNQMVDEFEKPHKTITMDDLLNKLSPYVRQELEKACKDYIQSQTKGIRQRKSNYNGFKRQH